MVLFLLIGFISGCSNEELTEYNFLFKGEGQHWSAEVIYEAEEIWGKNAEGVNTYSSEDAYDFTLTYKGDIKELASMEKLDYEFQLGPTGGGSASLTFDEPVSKKEFTSKGGGTGSVMREDMDVLVEVRWDGQEETFELNLQD